MPSTAKAGIRVFAAIVLCWIGICLCIHIGASDQTSFCSNTGDCNAVLESRFARFYGIPLPSIGIGFYSSLLVILLFSWATSRDDLRTLSLRISLLLAVAGALISLVLMYLRFVVLRSFCPLCTMSALLVILVAFLAFRLDEPPLCRRGFRHFSAARLSPWQQCYLRSVNNKGRLTRWPFQSMIMRSGSLN